MTETRVGAKILEARSAVANDLFPSPRVLFVNQAAVLGGGELSLLDISRLLPFQIRVALFKGGLLQERLQQAGVVVEVLDSAGETFSEVHKDSGLRAAPGALAPLARLAWRLQRLARRTDIVYANSQKAMVVSALAGAVARRPMIWHLRDILNAEHFSPAMRRLAVTVANTRASAVIANSHATAEAFIASGGHRKLVRVVHNGIDPKPFDAVSAREATDARSELNFLDNSFVIGVFGRLAPWKGQHVVLEALSNVQGVCAVFAGDALFGETDYKDELQKRAEQPGLRDRVRFLGFRDDVPRLMRAVDVVVHSSVNPEPFGRVIVEAMLARRPIVACAAGGVLEIIQDEKTGLLYPPGDVPALSAQIERLRNDPELCERLGAAGYAKAKECFSVSAMVAGVRDVVMDVYTGRKRPVNTEIKNDCNRS
jgi:glycosyltransferase involved in cell wall biosynthesis